MKIYGDPTWGRDPQVGNRCCKHRPYLSVADDDARVRVPVLEAEELGEARRPVPRDPLRAVGQGLGAQLGRTQRKLAREDHLHIHNSFTCD